MNDKELSLEIGEGTTAKGYQATTTSQQTAVFSTVTNSAITIKTTADIAVVQGVNPTAVYPANGVTGNVAIPAGIYRTVIIKGNKLAYIAATGTADVVINVEGA
jgi:hypothetical protein